MKQFFRFLFGATCLGVMANAALAGPNAGGTLIVHGDPNVTYTTDIDDYTGLAPLPDGCLGALTNYPADAPVVWWVKAAFPHATSPRLSGVVFGINYPEGAIALLAYGHSGDFELPDGPWPAPGSGTAVTWGTAQTTELTDVYWFGGYSDSYYGSGVSFDLIPHPTQGASFGDDSIPSILDPIAGLGKLGFGDKPGELTCPGGYFPGACCLDDGSCQILDEFECGLVVGVFQGMDTSCDPNPCPQPTGACCFPDGSCQVQTADACGIDGGTFQGVGTVCMPNPCPQPCEPFDLAGRSSATRPSPPSDPFAGGDPRGGTVGPNRGGTLVLHLDPTVAYSEEGLGTDCSLDPGVGSCADIVARTDLEEAVVVYAVALFPDGSAPRLVGLTFGIDYPDCVQLVEWQTCGDFELSDGFWPAPGSGTAMTWAEPQTDLAVPVYRFVAQGIAAEPGELALSVHPTQGALFADDSVPSILDPIAGLGSFGFFRDGVTPCPQPQEPIGACCFDDGTCTLLTIPDCEMAGGSLIGVNVPCNPNPCPQPTGACCFADGSCHVQTADACGVDGGAYQGDNTLCDPNPCPQPTGACCFPDGSCQVLSSEDCGLASGDYQGDNTLCNPNPCPQPIGACCFPDGSCQVLTSVDCGLAGGAYQGDDALCDPNPCPPPAHGACCYASGSCLVQTQAQCVQDGGDYQGDDTLCEPNPCPIPTDGACCLSLGTCEVLEETECGIDGGAFQGVGTVCVPNPCPQPCEPFDLAGRSSATRPSPPSDPLEGGHTRGGTVGPNRGGTLVLHMNPTVAYSEEGLGTDCSLDLGVEGCADIVARTDLEEAVVVYAVALFPDGSAPRLVGLTFGIDYPDCVQLLEWQTCGDFEISDGSWPAPGSGSAMTWTEPQTDLAVPVYRFLVEGIAAEPGELALAAHPTQGALFADDSIPSILDPIAGLGSFGFFRDGVTPCPQPQEPIGACCFEDGTCTLLTIPECDEAGGVLFGVNVPCNPNPCPQPAYGACCYASGTCLVQTPDRCAQGGGEYRGDDTNCDPNPCPQPPHGACCYANGTCIVRTPDECAQGGGDYQGDNTECNPNPCPQPTGACCFSDDICLIRTQQDCIDEGGEFLGPNVPCDPNPCIGGVGACCFPDGSCQYISESNCGNAGGHYLYDGAPCDPNPCPIGTGCGMTPTIEEKVAQLQQIHDQRQSGGPRTASETGRGQGTVGGADPSGGCGTLLFNADGTYENGYAWQYGGVVPPDYGAFAEQYSTPGLQACSVVLDLTQVGLQAGQTLDAYAWASAGGAPGAVLSVAVGADPGPIAFWPGISRHTIRLPATGNCEDLTWTGYWGNWPGSISGWYVGADLDGFGGCPVTLIAPGIGYPTGWHNVSLIWGPTQALGIGAEVIDCWPIPVRETGWGRIKALFR